MDNRTNQGYLITDSIHIGDTEFVLGVSSKAPSMFVTWACKDGDNYYWGHYHNDLLGAKRDLLTRAGEELEFQMDRKERAEMASRNLNRERER